MNGFQYIKIPNVHQKYVFCDFYFGTFAMNLALAIEGQGVDAIIQVFEASGKTVVVQSGHRAMRSQRGEGQDTFLEKWTLIFYW